MIGVAEFSVDRWLVEDHKDLLIKLFNGGFVFKAEFDFARMQFVYVMQHPDFEQIEGRQDYHVVFQGDRCKFVKGPASCRKVITIPVTSDFKAAQNEYTDHTFSLVTK